MEPLLEADDETQLEGFSRTPIGRRVKIAAVCLGLFSLGSLLGGLLGRASVTGRTRHISPAEPAPLPKVMLWRLQLVEHHPLPGEGDVTDQAFGLYYFAWDDPSGLVWSRQENAVGYESWRFPAGDVPWNTFWAVGGEIAVTLVNNTAGGVSSCKRLPYGYTTEFWPRDFLTSKCVPRASSGGQVEAMPQRFSSNVSSYDGRLGVARSCTLDGGGMTIKPTVWTDPPSGRLLRFDIEEHTLGWNPQTWDIIEQVAIDELEPAFRRVPEICGA